METEQKNKRVMAASIATYAERYKSEEATPECTSTNSIKK